ncbi:hypothetical protein HAX54_016357 [Datura stramonium]|uniref:Amine oxidase n=1 Tax=Datura stramonium TaxID=4076 RepID=A0ABS8UL01_DATST|nr:hypothetical protein [Datura stramonium]
MEPDEEKMTGRSPLDFPIKWKRPKPGRRLDIFPQFSPMKTPLAPPLPGDPPEEVERRRKERGTVRDGMRFVQMVLFEPDKIFVALADAYFFPPFQSSLMLRTKVGLPVPSKLPPRRARLIVYHKKTNETSIWIVQLTEDAQEYADYESMVKDYSLFMEALKRRGIDDMDLVMVDPCEADAPSHGLAKPLVIEFKDRKLIPLLPADPLRNYTAGETRGGVDRSFTPREGLVIHSVAYLDGSRGRRSTTHRLIFVEMVIPYGDLNKPHYRKNAFDAGEDDLKKNAQSLKRVVCTCSSVFFVARMNMEVDCKPGEAHNQIVEVNVKVEEPGKENVHHNAFYVEETLLRFELQAMSDCDPLSARHWIVRNTITSNIIGQLIRYVFEITHVPRLEDLPVMPVEHIDFMLQPHRFFNCSPAVDVPPPRGCDSKSKDSDVSENSIEKPTATDLMAKL